jgi:hypothetical protein
LQDGSDVLLLAFDAERRVVAARAVAAAVHRVGGHLWCQAVGQQLPVLRDVQGSGRYHQGRPWPVTVTAMWVPSVELTCVCRLLRCVMVVSSAVLSTHANIESMYTSFRCTCV